MNSTSVFAPYPLPIGYIAALRGVKFCVPGDTIIAWRPDDCGIAYTGVFVGEVTESDFSSFSINVDLATRYAPEQILHKEQYFSNDLGYYPVDRRIWSHFQREFFDSISETEKIRYSSRERLPDYYPGILFDSHEHQN